LDSIRRKHIRNLVHSLNKIRRRQTRQIDILCNDMVSAHGKFAIQLQNCLTVIRFYETLFSKKDLTSLLDAAAAQINNMLEDTKVAIFVLEPHGFSMHRVQLSGSNLLPEAQLESNLSSEIVHNISSRRHLCMIDEMWEMGLEDVAGEFRCLSAAAIPIAQRGTPVGFILLYRNVCKPLHNNELQRVQSILPGLCEAIRSTRALASTAG
jgi:transcriptional regulator with GAF, ATPase, and Fis domain